MWETVTVHEVTMPNLSKVFHLLANSFVEVEEDLIFKRTTALLHIESTLVTFKFNNCD